MHKGVHRLGVEKVKAIIAEIDKKHMIVITDKGDFIKVKRRMSAAVGDEIELKQNKIYPISKRLAGLAACFLACVFLSTGVYAYYTPYSYVSVDINPSLSLSLNRFERVISVNPLTEDAVDLIKDTKSLKNSDIDTALSEIIKTASEKGYIDEEPEEEIVVVVSAKNPKQEKKLEEAVVKTAAKELSKIDKPNKITVEKTNVENYKTAVSQKISPGRKVLGDNLKKIMPEIKDEDLEEMPVKEVVKLINEKRKAEKEAEKEAEKAKKAAEKEKGKDRSRDNGDSEERKQNIRDKDKKDSREQEMTDRNNRDSYKDRNGDREEDKKESDRRNRDDDKKKIDNRSDRKDDEERDNKNDRNDKNNKSQDNKSNNNNQKNDRNDKNSKNDKNDKNNINNRSKNNDNPQWEVNNYRNDGRGR